MDDEIEYLGKITDEFNERLRDAGLAPEHLQRNIEEQSFGYNERKGNDLSRFLGVIKSVSGKRLTYANLIGYQTNH